MILNRAGIETMVKEGRIATALREARQALPSRFAGKAGTQPSPTYPRRALKQTLLDARSISYTDRRPGLSGSIRGS